MVVRPIPASPAVLLPSNNLGAWGGASSSVIETPENNRSPCINDAPSHDLSPYTQPNYTICSVPGAALVLSFVP
jgi:hypothetical protein